MKIGITWTRTFQADTVTEIDVPDDARLPGGPGEEQ